MLFKFTMYGFMVSKFYIIHFFNCSNNIYYLYGQLFKFYISVFHGTQILHQWFYAIQICHHCILCHQNLPSLYILCCTRFIFYTFMCLQLFLFILIQVDPTLQMISLYHVLQGLVSVLQATWTAHNLAQALLQSS